MFQDMREILHVKPEEENIDLEVKLVNNIKSLAERFNLTEQSSSQPSKSARSHPEVFNSLLSAYFNRVSESQKLYEESIEIAKPVFNEILALKDLFENNCKVIESWFEDNKLEIAKIKDFPELYYAIVRYSACMGFLEKFYLFEFDIGLESEYLKSNQVLEILFCLYVLQTYGWWANPNYFPV